YAAVRSGARSTSGSRPSESRSSYCCSSSAFRTTSGISEGARLTRGGSERAISVGGVQIGGRAPVVVQSMTLTKTHDVEATTAQIAVLASAGCAGVRVAGAKGEDGG